MLAPGDAEEAFYLSAQAVNLAWRYQIPAIILSDKHLSESIFTAVFDKKKVRKEKPKLWTSKGEYKRYLQTPDGISPLAFPGQKGVVVKATGYEYDEFGLTVEDAGLVKSAVEKRMRKWDTLRKEIYGMETFKIYGSKKSSTLLIAWGSNKGAAFAGKRAMVGTAGGGFAFLDILQPCFVYFNTYDLYSKNVYDLGSDHDPGNRQMALEAAREWRYQDAGKIPIGVFMTPRKDSTVDFKKLFFIFAAALLLLPNFNFALA